MVSDEPRDEGADDSVFDTGVYGLPSVRRASYTPPSAADSDATSSTPARPATDAEAAPPETGPTTDRAFDPGRLYGDGFSRAAASATSPWAPASEAPGSAAPGEPSPEEPPLDTAAQVDAPAPAVEPAGEAVSASTAVPEPSTAPSIPEPYAAAAPAAASVPTPVAETPLNPPPVDEAPDLHGREPVGSSSTPPTFPSPEEQAALLANHAGPAGRPWVPQRASLDDGALVDEVTHVIEEADSLQAIEILQAQLRLREEEAHEYADWEQSMLAVGTPEALAAVQEVRPRFDDLVTPTSSIAIVGAEPTSPAPAAVAGTPVVDDESSAYWTVPDPGAAPGPAPWAAPWTAPEPEAAAPTEGAPTDAAPTVLGAPAERAAPTAPAEPPAPPVEPFAPPALVEPPPFPSAFSWANDSVAPEPMPAEAPDDASASGDGSAPDEPDAAESTRLPANGPFDSDDEVPPAAAPDPFAGLPGGFAWATGSPSAVDAQLVADAANAEATSAPGRADDASRSATTDWPFAGEVEPPAWVPASAATGEHVVEESDVWSPPWAGISEDTIDPYADLPTLDAADLDRPDVAPLAFLEPSGPIDLPPLAPTPDALTADALTPGPLSSDAAAEPATTTDPFAALLAEPADAFGAPPAGPASAEPAASGAPPSGTDPARAGAETTPDPFAGLAAPTGAPVAVPDAVVETAPTAADLEAEFGAAPQRAPFRIEDVGTVPTPEDQRVGRAVRLFWLWFAPNASVVSVALGAVVFALGISLRQAVIAVLAGVVLSFLPLGLGTLAGRRSGQPTMVVSRATFGVRGNAIPAIVGVLSRVFWGAALLWLLGSSVADVLGGAGIATGFGRDQLVTLGSGVGFLLALLVAFVGYRLIRIVQLVIAITSAVLVGGVIALTWRYVDLATALATPDGSVLAAVGGGVLVFSVVGLLWVHASGDLARYQSRGGRGGPSMLAASFGAGLPVVVLAGYGALLAASDPAIAAGLTSDPLDTLGRMLPLWYPVPLIAAAVLGLVSAVAVTVYAGSFALAATGLRMKQPVSTLLVAVLVFALAFGIAAIGTDVTALLRDLVTTVAVPVAAWAGMFATEVMIRSRRYHAPSLLATGGIYPAVRWGNLIAYLLISAIGLGFVTASTAGLTWEGFGFTLLGLPIDGPLATADLGVIAALVLGIIAPLVVGIPGIRRQQAADPGE